MQHLLNDEAEPRNEPVEVPATGMWASVRTVDSGEVTVTVDDFDRGVHFFGPVPYTGTEPDVDDRVFLHFDHRGRAAYAATFDT